MSPETEKTQYQIDVAAKDDWPWIIEGLTEIAQGRLTDDQRRTTSRQVLQDLIGQHVTQVQGRDGFSGQAFVARTSDGQPVGFVWVAKVLNEFTGQLEASLLNQYVEKPYRGQGLGNQLMATTEEWARRQGLLRISLRVGVHNRLGQKLYQKLGYEVDMLRMTKPLKPCQT